ncbi:hypothetical protein [Candidatus Formimonas warabiya]|uniref:Uncharacterized protein n=1 Tax=Formimonas warabiya TaxID=1761012 RepID=A0A3G1KUR0_FORW1|nr:hypothetical protein [Candidatus Formimonas warabiya]ATW26189.1 hypothetical protein DCMF_16705 [Candidatus Formimonas warabiya]
MKNIRLLLLVVLLVLITVTCVFAKESESELNAQFEQLKIDNILFELEENGIDLENEYTSLDELLIDVDKLFNESKINLKIKKNIDKLTKADYVIESNDGEIYSSKHGRCGKVEKIEENLEKVNEQLPLKSLDQIVPMSKENPTASEVHGGTGGAFSREQLEFIGFYKIKADITLPTVTINKNPETGIYDEQAWVYFGFDDENFANGIEAGFAYQTGTHRWLPYIRYGETLFKYDDTPYYDGDFIEMVRARVTDDSTNNVQLMIDYETIISRTKQFNNYNTLSVKKVSSIAKDGFDGTNISGSSIDCIFDDCRAGTIDEPYEDFEDFTLYSYWSDKYKKWYGTIDWPLSMIDRSGNAISID